jgi:Flp pilus assembly protein TadB
MNDRHHDHPADDDHDDDAEHDPAIESGPERPGSAAVYASNWRTVLMVDALMGVVVIVVGVVSMAWVLVAGAFVAAAGCTYVVLVARRARQWSRWRHDAGL